MSGTDDFVDMDSPDAPEGVDGTITPDDDLLDGIRDPQPTRSRWGIAVGLAIAIAGICFVVFSGMSSETYFYNVDQAVAQGPKLIGHTVRVKGTVEPGTSVTAPGGVGKAFNIAANGKFLHVVYDKALPDTFKDGIQVVVEGKVDHRYTLHADQVLVKCPSRYKGQPPTAMQGKSPQAMR